MRDVDSRWARLLPCLLVAVACLLASGLVPGAAAAGERRTALVVGNGAYTRAALANPVNDARAVAQMLRGMDFEVTLVVDAGEKKMKSAVRDFGTSLRGGGVGLFYFAGHGVSVDGTNYLIPVDVDIQEADEVKYDSLEAGRVLDKMESAGNGLNIVLLDACRDNPFAGSRSGSRGLAVARAPRGSIISYATAPGTTAADGQGEHSPYTKHLLDVFPTPGLTIEGALKEMRRRVAAQTHNRQIPWDHSSLMQDFKFVDGPQRIASVPSPRPSDDSGFSLSDLDRSAREQEAVIRQREAHLAQMQGAFEQAKAFERRSVAGELKVEAWQRFLVAYPEDDPYSREDEGMRRVAKERVADLRALALAAGGMLEVPGGEFWYGCNEEVDRECYDDEKPGGSKSLPTFRIDRTEVTVAEYERCVDADGCSADGLRVPVWNGKERPDWACNWRKADRARHPINCVDWNQAKAFCEWRGARLPSEQEWEKAARGSDGRKYSWGNGGYGSAIRVANIADETLKQRDAGAAVAYGYEDGYRATAPVGSYPNGESPYGVLDMIGNVWEWTASWEGSGQTARVLRGGSWSFKPRYTRASYRGRSVPRNRYVDIGFRCAQ